MLGLYTNRDVQKLVRRLREEYDDAIKQQKEVMTELKEQNRILLARVSQLETERSSVSTAIVHAVAEGERIKRESKQEAENERKELALLAEKCRVLSGQVHDAGDEAAYSEFLHRLHEKLDTAPQQREQFNMEDVLSPKEPLDLQQLCVDLGLMEGNNE
ncbi:MAG: hypothetical protein K2G44_03680 [Clostridia bacterium]|nr:hypothetical protein [Clostridia bacterium]